MPDNCRIAVSAKLATNGLKELDSDAAVEEIQTTIKVFRMLPEVVEWFTPTASCTKRVTQLMLWVTDQVRLGQSR